MNRIDKKFKQLGKKGEKAFIVYLTCGYPDLPTTKTLVFEMDKIGVDIIELGVPFSDPIAEGTIIQESSYKALKKGVNLERILRFAAEIRQKSEIPLVLMSYYNPVKAYGISRFASVAKARGVDGLIVPDLIPEGGQELSREMRKRGLDQIFLSAPTSTPERVKEVAESSKGFVYYVSLVGVTGVRKQIAPGIREGISRIRRFTNKPICIGFGVSSPRHVKLLRDLADGLISGSAIIQVMESNPGRHLIRKTVAFTEKMVRACKSR